MEIKEITNDNFDKEVINAQEKVLVDFNANWCGPCRMLRPILEEIEGVKIVSVDVDNNEELAKKYGVMSIPCLILFKDGQEINRSFGMQPKEEIEKMVGEE